MSTIDLTGFPERIQGIHSEYRAKSDVELDVDEVDELAGAGDAVGGIFLENGAARILIRKGLTGTERFQTICHEILHLGLSLQGYPSLEPLENDENAKSLVGHLESLLQHRLIMPIEQTEFGYDPYTSEHKVADSLYQQFTQLSDFGSPTDHLWQFVHTAWAVSFARVTMLASNSSAFPKLNEFFRKPEMRNAFGISCGLQPLIQQSDLTDPEKYTALLHIILDLHIQGNLINGTKRIQVGDPRFT